MQKITDQQIAEVLSRVTHFGAEFSGRLRDGNTTEYWRDIAENLPLPTVADVREMRPEADATNELLTAGTAADEQLSGGHLIWLTTHPMQHKTILGIDPGSRKCGYGLVEAKGTSLQYVASGVIRVETLAFPDRLQAIFMKRLTLELSSKA